MTYRNPLAHWPLDCDLVLALYDKHKTITMDGRAVVAEYITELHRTLNKVQRVLTDVQIERDRLLLENTFLTRQLQENEDD